MSVENAQACLGPCPPPASLGLLARLLAPVSLETSRAAGLPRCRVGRGEPCFLPCPHGGRWHQARSLCWLVRSVASASASQSSAETGRLSQAMAAGPLPAPEGCGSRWEVCGGTAPCIGASSLRVLVCLWACLQVGGCGHRRPSDAFLLALSEHLPDGEVTAEGHGHLALPPPLLAPPRPPRLPCQAE